MWLVAGRGLSRGRCPVAVDLERVRGGADQFPFAVDCCESSSGEAAVAAVVFDLPSSYAIRVRRGARVGVAPPSRELAGYPPWCDRRSCTNAQGSAPACRALPKGAGLDAGYGGPSGRDTHGNGSGSWLAIGLVVSRWRALRRQRDPCPLIPRRYRCPLEWWLQGRSLVGAIRTPPASSEFGAG